MNREELLARAAQDFIDKVDRGAARSEQSYAAFKAALSAPAQCAPNRDAVAQAIYETEPFYEGGEYVDGFQVSPGGNLSWKQACDSDAEFADDKIMLPITKFAYDAADRVLAISAVTSAPSEPAKCAPISECCREDVLAWEPCPPFQELQNENELLRAQIAALSSTERSSV